MNKASGDPSPSAPVLLRYGLLKLTVLTALAVGLALAALAGVVVSLGQPLVWPVMLAAAGFLGVWAVDLGQRLVDREPVLTISAQGIADRRIGPHTMPWAEIQEIYVFRARSQMLLAVVVEDPRRYLAPPLWGDRYSLWVNRMLSLPVFSTPLMSLEGGTGAILAALTRHLPANLQGALIRRRP